MQTQPAKGVPVVAQRKSTRILSEKVRAAAESRAMRAPLVVTGIGPGKLMVIQPSKFSKLDVDPSYQRGETAMIAELVRVIQAGGKVLDPCTLCRRPWSSDPDRLWVIDGHQRICAFQQLGLAFDAMVHESESVESEKQFFLALNKRVTVSGDVIVKSWTGASAKMLITANENPDHPLYSRVHFGQGAAKTQLGAALIIRGAAAAATGVTHGSQIQKQLAKLDYAMQESARRYLAEHYLRLFGDIYREGSVNSFVAIRLGLVAYQRWAQQGCEYPTAAVIVRLREINWRKEITEFSQKYSPVIINIIGKAWKP